MERHDGECNGPVTATVVPSGYDDEGPLPDELVRHCMRCGDMVAYRDVYDDDEVDAPSPMPDSHATL